MLPANDYSTTLAQCSNLIDHMENMLKSEMWQDVAKVAELSYLPAETYLLRLFTHITYVCK